MTIRFLSLSLLITSIISSCEKSIDSTKNRGKSRREQLKEIPYRGEIINDQVTNQIQQALQLIHGQTTTLNDVQIFYLTRDNQLKKLEGNWKNGTSAIQEANELWRDVDLAMTAVIYPSFSQDAVTGEVEDLWVIEVEHREVSRTCRLFFDNPTPIEIPIFNCN